MLCDVMSEMLSIICAENGIFHMMSVFQFM